MRFDPSTRFEVPFTLEHPEANAVEFDGHTLTLIGSGEVYVTDLINELDNGWMQLGPQGEIARAPSYPLAGATNVTRWHIVEEQA